MEKKGEIKIDSEMRRKKEERVGIKDRGEASALHNSRVIELIGTHSVFHFLSFVACVDERILIKLVNIIIPIFKSFKILVECLIRI